MGAKKGLPAPNWKFIRASIIRITISSSLNETYCSSSGEYPESPYLFVTERGGPMTPATARKLIARAGELAKFPFPIHPHMLRHSAGYKLANEGHDTRSIQQYLGHRKITHTVCYTELSPERFRNCWKE